MRQPPRVFPPPAVGDPPAAARRPYFLLIDGRFRVPIFVFVELEPRRPARRVTIEFTPVRQGEHPCWGGISPTRCLGGDPEHWDRFKEFPSDGHARAAGYVPFEPRYVGPSWESYLGAFRPEGERPPKLPLPGAAGR